VTTSLRPDVSSSRNYNEDAAGAFRFPPWDNFDSFFQNDLSYRPNDFASPQTTPTPTRQTYSPPTRRSTTVTAATATTAAETEPTPSTVFYKPFDGSDPNFTAGPFYYKPVESTTPSTVETTVR
jgi:hypothetical protein